MEQWSLAHEVTRYGSCKQIARILGNTAVLDAWFLPLTPNTIAVSSPDAS